MAGNGDPLETLRARLYAPQPVAAVTPEQISGGHAQTASTWKTPPPPVIKPAKKKLSLTVWFFIFAAAFFLVAGGIAIALLIFGGRSVSAAHVTVSPQGPAAIASGDTVPILISIKNENPVALTNAQLTITFPDGTRNPDALDQPLPSYTDTLGDIPPGQHVERTVRAALFGAENQVITVPIKLEYHTPNSNATTVKQAQYTVTVTTSPVSVNLSSVSEVASGQSVTVQAHVRSNAAAPLSNIAVVAEYPPGFVVTKTSPTPTTGSFFSLGTLAPGEDRVITVSGNLNGVSGDQRTFHFTVGTAAANGTPSLSVPYTNSQVAIAIAKPLLGATLSLNRDTSATVTVPAGQPVSSVLTLNNGLDVPVTDVQATVRFSGNAFDPNTVSTQGGYYRSNDATIIFSKDTNLGLASLQPNDSGSGTFSFAPRAGVRNGTVTVTVTITGTRAGSGTPVTTTLTRTVSVGTQLSLTSKLLHSSGPITNAGPWPPVPNQETQYTVQLSAMNSLNSIGGAVVTMKLPSYVSFTGKTSAGGTAVTYDETSRTVTWSIGDLAPSATAQANFQVSLLPSTSQEGTSPIVLPLQTFSGTDRFTQQQVTATADALTTQTPADPKYTSDKGVVK